MKAEVGKYKFGRYYNRWGIWLYNYVEKNGNSASFVKDVATYEDAVKEVYRLNGWGIPKQIVRYY